ncbi:MAG: CoxG family protein [archaeon]
MTEDDTFTTERDAQRTDQRTTDSGIDDAGDAAGSADETGEDRSSLEFSDTVAIAAGKDDLWEFISDAENLAELIPGAESVERHSERRYSFVITRGISHVNVSLEGEFELVEMNEPDWILADGEAFDTTTGSDFDVLAAMEMTETETGTDLTYSAEMYYSGGVARLGARLLRGVIESDVETYFENIRDAVEE